MFNTEAGLILLHKSIDILGWVIIGVSILVVVSWLFFESGIFEKYD